MLGFEGRFPLALYISHYANSVSTNRKDPCIPCIPCTSIDLLKLKLRTTDPVVSDLNEAVFALHSLGIDQTHDASVDLAQPMAKTLGRYHVRISFRCGDSEQELLERHRTPV